MKTEEFVSTSEDWFHGLLNREQNAHKSVCPTRLDTTRHLDRHRVYEIHLQPPNFCVSSSPRRPSSFVARPPLGNFHEHPPYQPLCKTPTEEQRDPELRWDVDQNLGPHYYPEDALFGLDAPSLPLAAPPCPHDYIPPQAGPHSVGEEDPLILPYPAAYFIRGMFAVYSAAVTLFPFLLDAGSLVAVSIAPIVV